MFKFSKKKEIKAEVKDVPIDEIKKIIERFIKCYEENNKSNWTHWYYERSKKSLMQCVVENVPIYYKINAAVLKYQRQLETANVTERAEIAEKLNALLNFVEEYTTEVFDRFYWEDAPYNYEYEATKKQLTKKLLKFLEPEIKEYRAQVKTKEKQRMLSIKERERRRKAEREVVMARRGKIYNDIKKM